jgi:hypothetical protein
VCCFDERQKHVPSGRVVGPDEILGVDSAPGEPGEAVAGLECGAAGGDEIEAGEAGMLSCLALKHCA